MKKIIVTLLPILVLFTSCQEQIEHTYYYSDGSIISDTNQLKVLNCELNTLLTKKELKGDLNIYTTLSKKRNEDFHRISNKYKTYVLDTLKKTYPEHSNFLDSLNEINRISSTGIIVFNNKTGEIENLSFNNCSPNSIYDNRLEQKAIHPYGFLMVFEKGKTLQDTFAHEFNHRLKDHYKIPTSITVAQSFSMVSGGFIMSKPYYFYQRSDWEDLKRRLHINLDLSEFHNGPMSFTKTNLFDLTKTISVISNNGFLKQPIYIKKIFNSEGKVIYTSPKNQKEKIFTADVIEKMKSLMEYYMISGQGRIQYTRNNIMEDCFIFTGSMQDYANWCVYTTDDYTIGLIEYNSLRTNEVDFNIERRRERIKVSLMLNEILDSIGFRKSKGDYLKKIEILKKDNF